MEPTEVKHTPGPYEDQPQPGGQRYIYARGAGNGNGALIMQVLPLDDFREEFEANVKLFLQAPDLVQQRNALLAALRKCEDVLAGYAACSDGCTCGDGWSHDDAKEVLPVVRDAIANVEKLADESGADDGS